MDSVQSSRALLVLTFVTGVIDATSFLALGQVFAAMQTGNVIFLGMGIAGAANASLLTPLIGLSAFMVGGITAAAVIRRRRPGPEPRVNVLLPWLALEAALLAFVAILALLLDVRPGHSSAYALVAFLSLTMGLRNSLVRGSAGPNLATTVLNLTLTRVTVGALPSPANQGDLRERGAAFLAILVGAVVGALLVKSSLPLAIALAAVAALGATLAVAPRQLR